LLTDTPAIVPPIETQPEISLWFTTDELLRLKFALAKAQADLPKLDPDVEVLSVRVQIAIEKLAKKKTK
jgi:hypothetical protein